MGSSQERLKVHRRTLQLDDLTYTVLSPRPTVPARFATSRLGDTWRVVTDAAGAQLLARLSWAMAYQRHARTLIVIDSSFLVPNPFDADPSLPIAIVNSDLGPFPDTVAASLRAQLPLAAPSGGTVVLQTRGLDLALADPAAFGQRDDQVAQHDEAHRRWIDRADGLMVMAASAPVLRAWGVRWSDPDQRGEEDEVHVLEGFADRVARTIELRDRLFPGRAAQDLTDEERHQMWSPGEQQPN
jgi:hypothetical protein